MSGWQNEPFAEHVKAGDTRAFCSCGLSKNGPYCDGSHKTTDKQPHMETFDKDKIVYICGCQKSRKRPYCDGSHQA